MTESTTNPPVDAPVEEKKPAAKKTSGGLGGKVLAELQEIAGELGIQNIQGMRKGALIDAIKEARGETPKAADTKTEEKPAAKKAAASKKADEQDNDKPAQDKAEQNKASQDKAGHDEASQDKSGDQNAKGGQNRQKNQNKGDQQNNKASQNKAGQNKGNQNDGGQQNKGNQNDGGQNNQNNDDDEGGQGRRRNRRGRNRNRGMDAEPTYAEDDVLVPAAGILDILDNYAFVRTTGYLPSEQDVYVSLSMVRKWGLRRGDAITGQVRQPREGERKEKFNPMVKVESVNGLSLDDAAKRVDFDQLTPVHPAERLRLESSAAGVSGRVIDLVAPVGKGQRGLIVSPPKAGKTALLQQVANAITENNPECHLMVVLVDERPEEVTDFQRTVKGEVISSTFDRPAGDHTTVAELAIERAERLVELGHDVVVLLDGITRLSRAYQQAAAQSSRGNAGGLDVAAFYPPKKFFGAARNIENGGSLTILATAAVETGSRLDEAIFEEFSGTANSEIRLRREFADKLLPTAIDVIESGTRRDELLLDAQETAIVAKLRSHVATLESQGALEFLLKRIDESSTNAEVLLKLNQSLNG